MGMTDDGFYVTSIAALAIPVILTEFAVVISVGVATIAFNWQSAWWT